MLEEAVLYVKFLQLQIKVIKHKVHVIAFLSLSPRSSATVMSYQIRFFMCIRC
jgi:hypothetical protein